MAKEDGADHGGHLRVDRSPYPLQHAAPAFHPHRRAHGQRCQCARCVIAAATRMAHSRTAELSKRLRGGRDTH
jgi:hypothetical protein